MTLDLISDQGESEGECMPGSAKALPQLSAPPYHVLIAFLWYQFSFLYDQMLDSDPEFDLTIVTVSILHFFLPWNSQGLLSHWDISVF